MLRFTTRCTMRTLSIRYKMMMPLFSIKFIEPIYKNCRLFFIWNIATQNKKKISVVFSCDQVTSVMEDCAGLESIVMTIHVSRKFSYKIQK